MSATIYSEVAVDTTRVWNHLDRFACQRAERDFDEADERLEAWLAERRKAS